MLWLFYDSGRHDYAVTMEDVMTWHDMTYHSWWPVLMVQCCRGWLCCLPGVRDGAVSPPPPPRPRPPRHPGYLNMRGEKTAGRSGSLTSQHPLSYWSAVLAPDNNIPGGDRPRHRSAAHLTWKGIIFIIYHQSEQSRVSECWTWLGVKVNQVSRGQWRGQNAGGWLVSADGMTRSPPHHWDHGDHWDDQQHVSPPLGLSWAWAGHNNNQGDNNNHFWHQRLEGLQWLVWPWWPWCNNRERRNTPKVKGDCGSFCCRRKEAAKVRWRQ